MRGVARSWRIFRRMLRERPLLFLVNVLIGAALGYLWLRAG